MIDLHTHTTASDGRLTPHELLRCARAAGIKTLSITDHDTVAAYAEVRNVTDEDWPALIPGVEFSTTWRTTGIHVLGLNIDPASPAIAAASAHQRDARQRRAEQISDRLARAGIVNALDGAAALAGGANIGRMHFARFLVESGAVTDAAQAFKKFLGKGKAGDVKHYWPPLEDVIAWIREAGGTAVLAHPGKYNLTRTKLLCLLDTFQQLGGHGLEVLSGRQDPALTRLLAEIAVSRDLLASCGSDFHQEGQPWARLGMPLRLPAGCRPVWENW